ncbi:MAG: DUF4190 domain-containing protein [Dactylosporangium sp.]|nr:DUF4190 domain-containing protein [Dactylosporangium sp.]NNJ60497.1 DUF4190 domain-containing protein [Dactylosporangium sp.]
MTYPESNDPYGRPSQSNDPYSYPPPPSNDPYGLPPQSNDPYSYPQSPGTSPYGQPQPSGDAYGYSAPPFPVAPPPYAPPTAIPMMGAPMLRQNSGLATASLVLGIIGFVTSCCTFGVLSLASLVCGHAALIDIRKHDKTGHGSAVAGLVLSYIVLAPAILFSIWVFFGAGYAAITGTSIEPSTTP